MPKFQILKPENSLPQAVSIIKNGGIVALATDTLYGIACDATNDVAVKRLYKIKERDAGKPISISVANTDSMADYVQIKNYQNLVRNLLPGPFTFIFPLQKPSKLSKLLNPNADNVGVRIPDNDFIIKLAENTNLPLALTSANLSGQKSPLLIDDFQEIWNEIDLIVDSGEIKQTSRTGSTIVDLTSENDFKIVREGVASDQFVKTWKSYWKNINSVSNDGEKLVVSQASGY